MHLASPIRLEKSCDIQCGHQIAAALIGTAREREVSDARRPFALLAARVQMKPFRKQARKGANRRLRLAPRELGMSSIQVMEQDIRLDDSDRVGGSEREPTVFR